MVSSAHVCDARPQPGLAAGDPAARELPRRRQGQDAHARQSLALARGQDRGVAPGAQGRPLGRGAGPAGDRAVLAARSCRGRARHGPQARPRPAPAAPARPAGQAGAGAGRGAGNRAGDQAGDGAPAQRGDGSALAGRGAGPRDGRRGRALPGARSLGRSAAQDRGGAGQAPSPGRLPRALRPHLELSRGSLLRAGPVRLQPRRQAGQAADRLRALVRCRWLPGGRRGVRGRYR